MYVMVLYLLLNGVPMEAGIRSENGKDYDQFATLAACQAQAKKDMAELFPGKEKELVLKCEKRAG